MGREWGDNGISLSGKEAEKIRNPLPSSKPCMALIDWNSLPYRLDYYSCREAWSNEEDLPGPMGPRISMEEIKQTLRGLGVRQGIHTLVSDSPYWASFTTRMKAKTIQSTPAPGMGC